MDKNERYEKTREWFRHPAFFLVFAVCILSMADAGQDMSLPRGVVGEVVRPEGAEARSLTPPLLGAFKAPDGAIRGLAHDGEHLWAANSGDDNSLLGHKIYRLDPDSGTVINAYTAPGAYSCGLAWDGTFLWCSAYITAMIYQLNPVTMTVERSFASPTTHPFDLAWDGSYLYAVRGNETLISVIDTASGQEVDSIAATYSSPNVRPFGLEFITRNAPHLFTSDGNYGSNMVNDWNFYANSWVDQWAADPATYPSGIAYDSVTQRLWVSCYARDSIYIYDASLVGVVDAAEEIARLTRIDVWPNPFSKLTNVSFRIEQNAESTSGGIELKIFDATGRLVRDFSHAMPHAPCAMQISWDGTDQSDRQLPPGVYFISAQTHAGAVKIVKTAD